MQISQLDTPEEVEYVDYVERRKRLHGAFFETTLPNEYLVEIGRKKVANRLALELAATESAKLEAQALVAKLRAALEAERLETVRLEREINQTWSREELVSELIRRLPETFAALRIDSYNVLSSGRGQGRD